MNVKTYLLNGQELKKSYSSDGCTLIGKWANDKYKTACYAHDFGRRGLLILNNNQKENDALFREALLHLGMKKWVACVIYYAVRLEYFYSENFR